MHAPGKVFIERRERDARPVVAELLGEFGGGPSIVLDGRALDAGSVDEDALDVGVGELS